MIMTLPNDYLLFWLSIAAITFVVGLILFAPIYYFLNTILKEVKKRDRA